MTDGRHQVSSSDKHTTLSSSSFINAYAGALNAQFLLESQDHQRSPSHLTSTSTSSGIKANQLGLPVQENELVYLNDSSEAWKPHASRFRLATTAPPRGEKLAVNAGGQGIAFRAKRGHHHSTWAKTFHSRPELYIQPQSVEEVQKIVVLARRLKKRLVSVGSRHSPSDLTCTSSWMVDLSDMNKILHVDKFDSSPDNKSSNSSSSDDFEKNGNGSSATSRNAGTVVFQAGISLRDLNKQMAGYGLTMPNLGSIDDQSFAGAIATGTHGSSLRHGLVSENVRGLRIVLADGRACWCSNDELPDLFQAALVSLGGLGIITEVEFEMAAAVDIEWEQKVASRQHLVDIWHKGFWTQAEFVRCWWMPYTDRMITWKADKTTKPKRKARVGWYGGALGYYVYLNLLWVGHHFTWLIPTVEWFVIGMQFGFTPGRVDSAVEEQRTGLLLDCLFSQHVNEWALPLDKGPEAITRLAKWIAGDDEGSGIPFPSKGVRVHCPIEVRVSDGSRRTWHSPSSSSSSTSTSTSTSTSPPRAFLDPTQSDGPTLYLNAIMYRPYGLEAPGKNRYYQAFEWLMKELGGRPHWAKNFSTADHDDFKRFYGDRLSQWLEVRDLVDPDGMFAGPWHRRNVLGDDVEELSFEEASVEQKRSWWTGGIQWKGRVEGSSSSSSSIEEVLEAEAAAASPSP